YALEHGQNMVKGAGVSKEFNVPKWNS
ncbi:hypothetical protein A2U01_0102931, partial [Trifolium medium]|nr:hypothetical protein [Trifolium medium]